ncbi:MaoC family dehydratase [Pannonibacter tanglangensis]|nr:MaoC family dehydratase [Pannonibacter sp. XCT-34]
MMGFVVGESASLTRRFSDADLAAFSRLSGTVVSPAEGVPGPLIGALFSCLLGVDLPGPGTNYLKQEMRFLAPVPLDVELTARVTITRLRPEKHLVDLETVCDLPDGTRVCEGRALVYVEDAIRRTAA